MALDDDNEIADMDTVAEDPNSPNGLTNLNPDAPDFAKDIKAKRSSIPLDMDYQFIPNNPYTMTTDAKSLGQSTDIEGIKEKSSFLATAGAEAKKFNATYQGLHAGYEKYDQVDPMQDVAPADWTPKTDQAKFVNVQPQYMQYLLETTGPKDQDYRLQRVMQEQQDDETLANGSFLAKLVGGVGGVLTDPMSYIPIAGWAKYGKLGAGFLKNATRALPGAGAYAVLSSGAEQANKINGNMKDFVTDSFVRTVFGTTLFGVGGVISTSAEKIELWNLRNIAKDSVDGVDYKLSLNEKGKINGFKAVDTTGSLSAAKASFYQDLADSSFAKSGIFKIPYLGEAVNKFLTMPVLGTPLPKLLNSPFKTVRGFIDRVADHSIITEGVESGQAAPQKFASLMNQTFASIRALSVQVDALHLERNGFDITNRPLGGLVNLGLNLKNKGLKLLASDMDKSGYISKEGFHSEIEEVLRTETPSKHAPVNEAAKMMREQMDSTYAAYREAYKLPKDWLPPKTAQAYLMRVYDTPYMNTNQDQWVKSIGGWLREADEVINTRMDSINTLSGKIKEFEANHTDAVHILANIDAKRIANDETSFTHLEQGTTTYVPGVNEGAKPLTNEIKPGSPVHELSSLRAKLRSMKDDLENELRSNEKLQLHVDDWNALSANEAKQVKEHTKKLNQLEKEVEKQKQAVREAKAQASRELSAAKNTSTIQKAIPKSKKYVETKSQVQVEEEKLRDLQDKHFIENDRLQQQMHNGEIDRRLFTQKPDTFEYQFKDPSDRLKFRDVYGTEKNPQTPEGHAKAYYDTIMNQTPEDTINQVMGKFTGNQRENPIKQRTLLIPDEVLYQKNNNFMAKDLMSKVSNYTSYLSRRTHLKTVFNDVSHEGGIEPILFELNAEHERARLPLNDKKAALTEQLKAKDLSVKEENRIEKQIKSVDKELIKTKKEFEAAKKQLNHVYEKMMGIQKISRQAQQAKSVVMSITAMANLPFVPFTMINDLSAIGLQHGIWPFIRDGVYPVIQSLGGLMKTKDSEAFRNSAPSVHLALQDVLNGYADRNWSMHNNPYLNLGTIVNNIEKVAHASTNFTLTNYIDNGLQRISGAVTQSEIMRILHAFQEGKMSKRDGIYVRKYGIDPKEWSDRMINAFKQDGGGKTKLGGYQSNFWQWQDLEASNKFSSAVFRGIKDSQIQQGIADSPFWTDSILGSIIKGFNGWTYASVNRYVIPSMQKPDAQKLMGVLFMLGTGALVSPMRRMARGDTPYPDNVTDKQMLWQTIQDSGYFSFFSNIMADANVLTGDRLMGDLKNDKYKDRTRVGLLGPSFGTANRMADIIGALGSNEMNQTDAKKFARMMPFANASWTYWMSQKLIDSLDLPKNRTQAHALKELNQ